MNNKIRKVVYQTREEFWAEVHEHRRRHRAEMNRLLGRKLGGALARYRARRNRTGNII